MNKVVGDKEYRLMVNRIKDARLLALPQSAAKILELSKDPENGPPEYAAAISTDLGLAAQILRFVNSSYFGFRDKITTIQTALSLVYGRTIKNFILWNAVFAVLPDPQCGPFELKKICQDSLRRGVFAKVFGAYFTGLDPEELFLSSLFQDLALPILAQVWPGEYTGILSRRQDEKTRVSELEWEIFGWNHAHAGAYLAEEWGFDEQFCNAIADHLDMDFNLDIDNCSARELQNTIVALAGLLPSVVDGQWDEADEFYNVYFRFIRPGMPYPDALFARVEAMTDELFNISQIGPVVRSLSDFHKNWLETFG